MNIQHRQAWFILKVAILSIIAYLALVAFIGFRFEAVAAFGVFGIAGFASLIGSEERRKGTVVMDERDQEIAKAAGLTSAGVLWLCFCGLCMIPFFVKGPNAVLEVPTNVPPTILILGMIIGFTVRSLVVVVMYQRGMPRDQE